MLPALSRSSATTSEHFRLHLRAYMAKTRRQSALAGQGGEPPAKRARIEAEEGEGRKNDKSPRYDEGFQAEVLTSGVITGPSNQGTSTNAILEDTDVTTTTIVTKTTSRLTPKRPRISKPTIRDPTNTTPDPTTFPKRANSAWKIGAHVSAAGGVENAVLNAANIGATAFALFVKSQRKWVSPPLDPASVEKFKERMGRYGYDSSVVLPHGSYLINLGNPDESKRDKSYECFIDDLKRCEQLGLTLYNFHPGSSVGATTTEHSLSLIAECLNRAHKETVGIVTVLENMAGAGNIIGGDFSHLAGIIALVEDKTRVGVCLDTCHAFAAGYDIRTKEGWNETIQKFDQQVGIKYLRGMHLNDSKASLASKKDRHENIGLGQLGLSAFHHIITDPRIQGIPLILETPNPEVWKEEIGALQMMALAPAPGDEAEAEEGEKLLLAGIRDAVKEADSSAGKVNTKRKVKGSGASGKRKGDVKVEDGEGEDEEGEV